MDKVIVCKFCELAVHTTCEESEHAICSLFKSQQAYKHKASWGPYTDKDPGGAKDDDGKVPLDLLAPEFLTGTATVLQFGAKKYAAYNWAKGMKWSRVFAALMRHMWKWWAGEKLDPETGLSHLWHAACGLMFLIAYEQRGTGNDDRPV